MSQEHVGYPYDWAARDAVGEWWEIYGDKAWEKRFQYLQRDLLRDDPWVNGRYALSAMVWGLIIMFVVSVMA